MINNNIKKIINDLGYTLLSINHINKSIEVEMEDMEGYKYQCLFSNLKRNKIACKFSVSNKYTLDNIRLFLKNSDLNLILISSEFLGSDKPLCFIDQEGYFYTTTWDNLKQKHLPKKFYQSSPYTIQNIKLWCKLNKKDFKLLSDIYYNNSSDLKWQCSKENCKEIFYMDWNKIISGCGCPYCVGKRVGISNCLTTKFPEIAKEWHPTRNGDLTPNDVTYGCEKYVWWQCGKNPIHEWYQTINQRTSRLSSCPYCSHQLPSEEYNLLVYNPKLCEEWNYSKNEKKPEEYLPFSTDKVWWVCDKGHEWETYIYSRNGLKKVGCPTCNESKGENKVSNYLFNNKIDFIPQKTFKGCKNKQLLQFDFYLPNYNICIEYQGQQHYEPVDFAGKGAEWAEKMLKENQIKDQIKRDYCNKNNIRLIEISYWDFDTIEFILSNVLKR